MTPELYSRYRHSLLHAYSRRGLERERLATSFPEWDAARFASPDEATRTLIPGIKQRLDGLKKPLGSLVFSEPLFRQVELLGHHVTWPIINQQGHEWYYNAPMANFDFLTEYQLGLLQQARVIYDFGGHHGIWALFYALIVGTEGRVYTFEPSLMNIEVSNLLFLINSMSQVVNFASAIGNSPQAGSAETQMLIDFIDMEDFDVVNISDVTWDRADFLKMDIEGFEYDIITNNPWIFDLATHMHIELHIPHLLHRGLDYRDVTKLIPFHQFHIWNYHEGNPITPETHLEGFCSLMMKRK